MMFVVFLGDFDYMHYIFNRNTVPSNVIMGTNFNNVIKQAMSFHFSMRINEVFNIPGKRVWYKFLFNENQLNKYSENYFVFFEGSQLAYDYKYLSYLRNKFPKCKLVFRYTNPITSFNKKNEEYIVSSFDLVVSMDRKDCAKKGWLYIPNTYCSVSYEGVSKESDVFFVGRDKGRMKQLLTIYDSLTSQGLLCDFYISHVERPESFESRKGIHIIDNMRYIEIIEHIKRTRCILEVLQENQTGSSLRPMEAISFNKYLLTNNKSIVNEDYFDENSMIVFSDIKQVKTNRITSPIQSYKNAEIISNNTLFKKIEQSFLCEQ